MGYSNLIIQIVRYVSDDPFPGVIACEFVDAAGQSHTLIEKITTFSLALHAPVDETTLYPQKGAVRCEVLAHWQDANGRDLARISLTNPDSVESTEGLTEFVVLSRQLST